MNRHGISQNPTAEEARELRRLWAADDARARTERLIHENRRLLAERDRLLAERDRLLAERDRLLAEGEYARAATTPEPTPELS